MIFTSCDKPMCCNVNSHQCFYRLHTCDWEYSITCILDCFMDESMMQPKFLSTYILFIMGLMIAYPYFLSSGSFTTLLMYCVFIEITMYTYTKSLVSLNNLCCFQQELGELSRSRAHAGLYLGSKRMTPPPQLIVSIGMECLLITLLHYHIEAN